MRNLLLSSATLLLVPAVSVAAPDFPSHTHTYTPIELKPISDISSSLKLASICFLGAGDCGDARFSSLDGDDDYKVDTVQQCKNEGYSVTSCSLPAYPSGQCPYNGAYFAKCVEDRPRACKEADYVLSCGDGYILDNTQLCPYDSSYKKCKCNPCDDYAYTYAQATASGYGIDIPTLENTPWAGAGVYVKGERDSYQIRDGKENTQKILAYGKANNISYPAAEAANKYQPEGCASGSWCGAGNWYLPSNYQVFAYFDNRETILEMLEAINKLPDDWWYTRRDFYTITSNEIDDKQCGFIYINTGGMAGSSKQISVDQPDVILPFISY